MLLLLERIYLIIVHLQGGVDSSPAEPHHVVLPVIHLAAGVSDHDVLLAEVVGDHHIATDLNIFTLSQPSLSLPPSPFLWFVLIWQDYTTTHPLCSPLSLSKLFIINGKFLPGPGGKGEGRREGGKGLKEGVSPRLTSGQPGSRPRSSRQQASPQVNFIILYFL